MSILLAFGNKEYKPIENYYSSQLSLTNDLVDILRKHSFKPSGGHTTMWPYTGILKVYLCVDSREIYENPEGGIIIDHSKTRIISPRFKVLEKRIGKVEFDMTTYFYGKPALCTSSLKEDISNLYRKHGIFARLTEETKAVLDVLLPELAPS